MIAWIVMPARNEEHRIGHALEDYSQKLKGRSTGIVVVSSSSDGTDKIVEGYSRRYNFVKLIKSAERDGNGGAIINGFRYALRGHPKFIGFVDADDSVGSAQFLKMLSLLKKDKKISGVIASRYVKGSKINGTMPFSRLVASRLYNILVRALFRIDVKDTQCGAKIFRSAALKGVVEGLTILGMSFDIDLLYSLKLKGKKVKEFGVVYDQVNEGTSISIATNAPQMLVAAFGFRIYKSRFGKLVPQSLLLYVYNRIKRW